jgi:hypothetical protein
LSNDVALSSIEKLLLARAYRVAAWLEEAVTSLATCDLKPTLEDLATLGWETAARILWIWYNDSNTLCFKNDAIKCAHFSTSLSLRGLYTGHCEHILFTATDLSSLRSGLPTSPGTTECLVLLKRIQCKTCGWTPFTSHAVFCQFCSKINSYVRITLDNTLKQMIEEVFGEEIKDYEPDA